LEKATTVRAVKRLEAGDIAERLVEAIRFAGGQKQISDATGIATSTLTQYMSGRSRPGVDPVVSIAYATGYTIAWLASGRGPKMASGEIPGIAAAELRPDPALTDIRIIGLSETEAPHWYAGEPLPISAARPRDFLDPEGLSVIAPDDSMVPAGIARGFLLYCSPLAMPAPNDAVYIETKMGRISIRQFRRLDAQWLTVEAWFQDEDGRYKIMTDQLSAPTIRRIAPVIYIKRKL